jgi:hypothetical protein
MGFLICNIQPLEGNRVRLKRVRHLVLGGPQGCFARHLPGMTREEIGQWTLTAEELMCLDQPGVDDSSGVFFELASGSKPDRSLLQLIKVCGRTASLITDALFHFKAVGPAELEGDTSKGDFIVQDWHDQKHCYEQIRLEGGFAGGNWAWSEPPQTLGASAFFPDSGGGNR